MCSVVPIDCMLIALLAVVNLMHTYGRNVAESTAREKETSNIQKLLIHCYVVTMMFFNIFLELPFSMYCRLPIVDQVRSAVYTLAELTVLFCGKIPTGIPKGVTVLSFENAIRVSAVCFHRAQNTPGCTDHSYKDFVGWLHSIKPLPRRKPVTVATMYKVS